MSTSSLMAAILFGSVGFAAFIYGKKQSSAKPLAIGILLMAYPYFVQNATIVWLVGIILTAALIFWR